MQMTQEDKETQNATSNARFMQTIFASVGGAIMFGLVGAGAKALIDMAGTAVSTAMAPVVANAATGVVAHAGLSFGAALISPAALFPVLGLVGIAAFSLACVYAGAQFMSKTVNMEQETQAQKIAQAHGGKGKEIDIQPTRIEKTSFIPGVTAGDKTSEPEASNDNNRLVAENSAMNQAASRIDASSVAGTQRVNEQQLQRA